MEQRRFLESSAVRADAARERTAERGKFGPAYIGAKAKNENCWFARRASARKAVFVVTAFSNLMVNEHFVTLLRRNHWRRCQKSSERKWQNNKGRNMNVNEMGWVELKTKELPLETILPIRPKLKVLTTCDGISNCEIHTRVGMIEPLVVHRQRTKSARSCCWAATCDFLH